MDKAFSIWIRERDNWSCQVCGRNCENNKGFLDNSHFHSRSIMSTRFDPNNCDAFCKPCHMRWENRKTAEYGDWKKAQLGESKFKKLKELAYRTEYLVSYNQKDLANFLDKFIINL